MKIGKLSNEELSRLVLSRLPGQADPVTSGPAVGLDCAVIRFGDGQVVLTTDPITGAANEIGRLAIHVSCNDIASCGIRPNALLMALIAPPQASPEDIQMIVDQAAFEANKLKVSIIGGHTEISDAVNRFVITTTALGFAPSGKIILASGGKPDDSIVMTKSAGLEGTAIFAADQSEQLATCLSSQELAFAKNLINQISVVEEGCCGGSFGVHAMHDATEGGILGACWELAQASGLGVSINADLIPIHSLTKKICACLKVDPLRLIASGSLIMATDRPEELVKELAKIHIDGTVIGKLTNNAACKLQTQGRIIDLCPPGPDELYKINSSVKID